MVGLIIICSESAELEISAAMSIFIYRAVWYILWGERYSRNTKKLFFVVVLVRICCLSAEHRIDAAMSVFVYRAVWYIL